MYCYTKLRGSITIYQMCNTFVKSQMANGIEVIQLNLVNNNIAKSMRKPTKNRFEYDFTKVDPSSKILPVDVLISSYMDDL